MINELRKEEEFLIRLIRNDSSQLLFDLMKDPTFDMGYMISNAVRHKLIPILLDFIIKENGENHFRPYHLMFLKKYARSVAFTNKNYLEEASNLNDALNRAQISHLFLKGCFLMQEIYASPHLREIGDLDLYIPFSELDNVRSFLKSYGCFQKPIMSSLDKEIKFCLMFNVSLPVFLKKNENSPFPPEYKFDVSFGLVERKSDRKLAFTQQVMEKYREQSYKGFPFLSKEDNCLHLLLQIATDFNNDYLKKCFSNAVMVNFLDLMLLIEKEMNWELILELTEPYNLDEKLSYAITMLEAVKGTPFPDEVKKWQAKRGKSDLRQVLWEEFFR